MERRKFTRELKLEAVRLIKDLRGRARFNPSCRYETGHRWLSRDGLKPIIHPRSWAGILKRYSRGILDEID